MKTLDALLFFIGYYITWSVSIYSAAHHWVWFGFSLTVIISLAELYWLKRRYPVRYLIRFVVGLTFIGCSVDSLLSLSGFITFNAIPWRYALAPPWIIGLWINFSIVYFAFMRHYFLYYKSLAACALIGFPLAYSIGAKFGAAHFTYSLKSSLLIGLIWAILIPIVNYNYIKIINRKGKKANVHSA